MLSSDHGQPWAIQTTLESITQVVGVPFRIDARAIDRRFTPVPTPVEAEPSNESLRVDSTIFDAEMQRSHIYVTPLVVDSAAYLYLYAGAVHDTVHVKIVDPPAAAGL